MRRVIADRRPSKGRTLNCPGCDAQVAADEAICPRCDYIIDSSFLSDEVAAPAPRRAAGGGSPRRTGARAGPGPDGARPPRPRGTGARPSPRPAPPRPSSAASRYGTAEYDPDLDGPLDEPKEERPAYQGRKPASGPKTGAIMTPDEAFKDISAFFAQLGLSDRLAFFGALVIAGSCFFPWKSTLDDGDVLGLMSQGVVAFITSGILMSAVAIRTQRFMPQLHPLIPWLVQLASAAFTALWILIVMRLSWDATEVPSPIGNYTMMRSSPSFGAWIALLGAGVTVTGTLLGLREKAR